MDREGEDEFQDAQRVRSAILGGGTLGMRNQDIRFLAGPSLCGHPCF
jgi:hypothetical protein